MCGANLQLDKHREHGDTNNINQPENTRRKQHEEEPACSTAALTNRANTIYTDWKICFRKKGFKLSF